MMDLIAALGVAGNAAIDSGLKAVSKTKEVHRSADGA